MSLPVKPRKWYQIKWFQDYDTAEERKLITKLDLLIVPYVFLVSVLHARYATKTHADHICRHTG
jgi:hypothetical protein